LNVTISPDLRSEILNLLDKSAPLGTYYGGTYTRRFEAAFAAAHGDSTYGVATNSGTSALHVALAAAGVGPGDEVIVQTMCFVSAASVIVQVGATPVICDLEPHSLTLDLERAESLITERTKAILPVHYWGYPANMPALRALCDRHSLVLIEDSCQAPLAPVGDRSTGMFGDLSAYAFCDRKHIRSGEGGMVLCHSRETADRLRSLVNFGKGPEWDDYEELGYSYRMVELSALICLDGLSKLRAEQQARQEAAAIYRTALADTPLLPVPEPDWGRSIYFKLPIILPTRYANQRSFMVEAVSAENVSCRIPHRPLYEIPWLAKFLADRDRFRGEAECPVTADVFARMVEVETGPHLPAHEAAASARAVRKVWRAIEAEGGGVGA
jgi:perosamine synthetase